VPVHNDYHRRDQLTFIFTLVAVLEGMMTATSNDVSSISPDSEASATPERQGVWKTIISLADRGLWIQSIKMLNQAYLQGHVPLPLRTIAPPIIRIISDKVVYEGERVRRDGLNILANQHMWASESSGSEDPTTTVVATALLASVKDGLKLEPRQQFLNTIEFIRTLWGGMYHAFTEVEYLRAHTHLVSSQPSPLLSYSPFCPCLV
jgi:hypothetical protein